ncbi:MAG: MBOAT family O-acyltransferase [Eubacterium sp.]
MVFNTLEFLVFLVIALLVYAIWPKKYRWICLLGISLVFYAIAGIDYLPYILFTSFTIYLAGMWIGHVWSKLAEDLKAEGLSRDDKKALKKKAKAVCKRILLLALVLNLGILCYTKFTKFLVEPVNNILNALETGKTFSAKDIIVPLGISYYTFSTVGYLLDVYWKRYECEKNYARFLLYACYFPHILQGPIERYNRLGMRLKQELVVSYDNFVSGYQLMLWGYFKKMVIADRLDVFITSVYSDIQHTSGIILILTVIFDVFYIYTDFSGCMDIARGVSQMFGVELDLNFNHPFFSKSVTEFWRRWHMSLGGWFKDYVYYPISTSGWVKNIGKFVRKHGSDRASRIACTIFPVVITWFLTGLWHGTGKTYIAWGLYYGFMIMCSITFKPEFEKLTKLLRIKTDTWFWKFFQTIRTCCIFAGGRILTRPGSLYNAKQVVRYILMRGNMKLWELSDGTLFSYGLTAKSLNVIIVSIAILITVSVLQEKGSLRERLRNENIVLRWGLMFGIIFAILVYGVYGPGYDSSSFAYMEY